MGFGAYTAAIASGGAYDPGPPSSPYTESYNGTSWTEVNDLNQGRQHQASFGTSTAGVNAAGFSSPSPGAPITTVENWDGTSWTTGTAINTARSGIRGAGSTTAGIVMGGYNPPPTLQMTNTEVWNGSSWTEVNELNTRKTNASSSQG